MQADTLWKIYFGLSLAPVLPLLAVGVTHALPHRLTSMPQQCRVGGIGVSLIGVEIVRSAKVVLARVILGGSGPTGILCDVDTALTVYLTTALVTHLPLLTYSRLRSTATSESPNPSAPRARYLLPLAYTYALLPLLPIFADAGMSGFDSPGESGVSADGRVQGSFGIWWGFYCREAGDWWRIARPATLLPPVLVTIPLTLSLFALLYSAVGHPSTEFHSTRRDGARAVFMLFCALLGVAYLVMEQVLGWQEGWWARIFECTPPYLVLLAYASSPGLSRTWWSWLRFTRATPDSAPDEPEFKLPSTHTLSTIREEKKRPTSSFYALGMTTPAAPAGILRSTSKKYKQFYRQDSRKAPGARPEGAEEVRAVVGREALGTHTIYRSLAPPSGATQPAISAPRSLVPPHQPIRQGDTRTLPRIAQPKVYHSHTLSRGVLSAGIASAARDTVPPSASISRSSGTRSPPFTWSVAESTGVSETFDTVALYPTSSQIRAPLATTYKQRILLDRITDDDASSVSRYSMPSPTGTTSAIIPPTPRPAHVRASSYASGSDAQSPGGSETERRSGPRPRKRENDWVYPEEVFLDFTQSPAPPQVAFPVAVPAQAGRSSRMRRYDDQRI